MNENPDMPSNLRSDTPRRKRLTSGLFARIATSLATYVVAASLGATASLNCFRPCNTFAELLSKLYQQFVSNWGSSAELAIFSLLSIVLIHNFGRVNLAALIIRALIFGFIGGFLAMYMPAIEFVISEESTFKFLRWFARKPFWVYIALVTCIQLLFELVLLLIDRFLCHSRIGLVENSDARIKQS